MTALTTSHAAGPSEPGVRELTLGEALAEAADAEQELYLVPAFTGLGAPYWDAECRGAVFGLTRGSGPEEFARADAYA